MSQEKKPPQDDEDVGRKILEIVGPSSSAKKKESKERESSGAAASGAAANLAGAFEEEAMESGEGERDAAHFRRLLESEVSRLTAACQGWEAKLAGPSSPPEGDAADRVRAAVGKAR